MTTEATIARKVAMACEAKKHAYRQTQDGVVVSFVLHPQEVPEGLAIAPLGQRFQLVMVALGEDDTPQAVPVKPASTPKPARAPRPFISLPLPQQAVLLCNDPIFRAFLNEEFNYECDSEVDAAEALREKCNVASRSELLSHSKAGSDFISLREQYMAWKLVAA